MAFTLQLVDQLVTFDDDAAYRFNDAGLLVVREGDNRRRIFSPNSWTWLEDVIPPGRGPRRDERDDDQG